MQQAYSVAYRGNYAYFGTYARYRTQRRAAALVSGAALRGSRPPPAAHSCCFFEEPNNRQTNYSPIDGVDDFRDNPAAENNPEPRQEPAGNEGADNADHDVADEPKAVALHDKTCEPAGNRTNNQPNDKTLNCHDHPPHNDEPTY